MQSLVVENDTRYRERLIHVLDELHIGVHVADTADAAMIMLRARRFDITVLDMGPGPVSGWELVQRNRPRIAAILIGESQPGEPMPPGGSSTPVYCLKKPIDYGLFQACLRSFSEQKRLRQEVARLQREVKRLRGAAVPGDIHEVDELWFRLLGRIHRRGGT